MFYIYKKVELNVIKLFKLISKKDIITLNEDDFNNDNKQYLMALKDYKRALFNNKMTKYIFIIFFFFIINIKVININNILNNIIYIYIFKNI